MASKQDVQNEDWIKTGTWDLPRNLRELVGTVGPEAVAKLPSLPAWRACPPRLKAAIQVYNNTTKGKVNP